MALAILSSLPHKGSKLINPTFIQIRLSSDNMLKKPYCEYVLTIVYIPTGPDNNFKLILPVIKYIIVKNICSIVLKNLTKAYFGYRTKNLIFYCLRAFAREMNCDALYGVTNE